ncbi:MAG: hypothetical protein EXR21_05225 [Flavobacteriaceae bacterium]|nr:hypothetical protein [Flavobacteriaceae bacterium]
MKKIFNLVSILFISGNAFSQVAGYMGQRLSATVDVYVSPYIKSFLSENSDLFKPLYPGSEHTESANVKWGGGVQYCLNRTTQVGFNVGMYNSQLAYAKDTNYSLLGSFVSSYPKQFQFRSTSFVASITKFMTKNDEIAPVGRYVRYSLGYNHFSYFDMMGDKLHETNGDRSQAPKGWVGGLAFGKQRVYFDQLLVDFGIEFQLSGAMLRGFQNIDGFYDSSNDDLSRQYYAKRRYSGAYFTCLYLRLGGFIK